MDARLDGRAEAHRARFERRHEDRTRLGLAAERVQRLHFSVAQPVVSGRRPVAAAREHGSVGPGDNGPDRRVARVEGRAGFGERLVHQGAEYRVREGVVAGRCGGERGVQAVHEGGRRGERRDRTGRPEVGLGRPPRRDADEGDARTPRRLGVEDRVADERARGRRDAERAGGDEQEVRLGLARSGVRRRRDGVDEVPEVCARARERRVEILLGGGRREGEPQAARPRGVDERERAVEDPERLSGGDPGKMLARAVAEGLAVRGLERRPEQVRREQVAAFADAHVDAVGRDDEPEVGRGADHRLGVGRVGVDERPVEVEQKGGEGHRRRQVREGCEAAQYFGRLSRFAVWARRGVSARSLLLL